MLIHLQGTDYPTEANVRLFSSAEYSSHLIFKYTTETLVYKLWWQMQISDMFWLWQAVEVSLFAVCAPAVAAATGRASVSGRRRLRFPGRSPHFHSKLVRPVSVFSKISALHRPVKPMKVWNAAIEAFALLVSISPYQRWEEGCSELYDPNPKKDRMLHKMCIKS